MLASTYSWFLLPTPQMTLLDHTPPIFKQLDKVIYIKMDDAKKCKNNWHLFRIF